MSSRAIVARSPEVRRLDDLLDAVGTGDRDAFAELYRLTAVRLIALVTRVLRDPAQSEEVAQETYLEIWQTSSRFDRGLGSSLSWMFTMGRRRAIDRVRSAEASRTRDYRVGVSEHAVDHDSVSERGELSLESARVRGAMGSLSAVHRRSIELTYFDGCSQSQVARITGVALSTAKSRTRDALHNLRRALDAA